jgi:TP901 family phage tail tape measure protein
MAGKKQIAIEIQIKNIKQIKVLENQLKKLRKEQRELAKTNKEAKKLSGEEAKVYQRKDAAIRKASKALRENKKALADVNKGANATKKSSGSLTKSFIKGAAAVGILISAFRRVNEIISSMLGIFTSFEFVMAKVQAVSGANADEFKRLSDTAQELGRSTFFTAEQVGQLQLNYSKLGFTTSEILAAQRATLDLSVATGSDLARAAIVAGAAVRGFGLDAVETQRVVDVMAVSFSSSAMDMEKWQTAMTKVAPIAKAAGFSIEDTAAIMSKLTDTGIEASIAGTSLRNILLKMQDPSSDLTKVFGTTIHSLDQLVPAMNKFVAEGGDMADVMGVVDIRQAAAFESMVTSADATLELRDAMLAANGEGSRMAGIVGDTLHGAWLKLKSAMEGIAIVMMEDVGGALKDGLVSFAKWLNALVKGEKQIEKFKKGMKRFGTIIKWVITLFASYVVGTKLAALSTVLFGKGVKTATGYVNLWTFSLAKAKIAMKAFGAALATTGVGLFVVVLADLVYAMSTFNEEADKATDWTKKLEGNIRKETKSVGELEISLKRLIEAKKTIDKYSEDEVENLKKGTLEYAKYKKQLVIATSATNTLNTAFKKNGDELIDLQTDIADTQQKFADLAVQMRNTAAVSVASQMSAEIIKAKMTTDNAMQDILNKFKKNGTEMSASAVIAYAEVMQEFSSMDDWSNDLSNSMKEFFTGNQTEWDIIGSMIADAGLSLGDFTRYADNALSTLGKDRGAERMEEDLDAVNDKLLELFPNYEEYIKLVGDDPDGKKGEGPTPIETFKVAYDERIRLLIDSYRTQKEVEITHQEGHKEMVLLNIHTLAEEKIKAQIKANQAEQKFREKHATLTEKTEIDGVSELSKKIVALKKKEAQLLLDLDLHYLSEKERLLKIEYDKEADEIKRQMASGVIDQTAGKNLLLKLEANYLNARLGYLVEYSQSADAINQQILDSNVNLIQSEIDLQDKLISKYGSVGGALTKLAGENESLNAIREVGNAITQAAAIAETILTLKKDLASIASLRKAQTTTAETVAETASLAPKATGVALDSAKGWPFPINIVAILATLALLAKVMGMFEKGGVIQEFAEGGMVRGKSHAQGGEKFNVGGRVVELEGGEAVINKRSTAMFRNELSSMNQAGGGVKFADGGLTNLPSFTKSHFDVLGQEGMMGAMGQGSRVVVVESDITETQNTVSVIESQATF